jgi:hypothetical protein
MTSSQCHNDEGDIMMIVDLRMVEALRKERYEQKSHGESRNPERKF